MPPDSGLAPQCDRPSNRATYRTAIPTLWLGNAARSYMHTKDAGTLGEAMVIADAVRRGYKVAVPLGENGRYDLIVDRLGRLERVQVKYTRSDGAVVRVKCRSTNNWSTIVYSPQDFEWLAVYDHTTDACYYLPSALLGGRTQIHLRLGPTRNGQDAGCLWANEFQDW